MHYRIENWTFALAANALTLELYMLLHLVCG
jgi:hypothetical protein